VTLKLVTLDTKQERDTLLVSLTGVLFLELIQANIKRGRHKKCPLNNPETA